MVILLILIGAGIVLYAAAQASGTTTFGPAMGGSGSAPPLTPTPAPSPIFGGVTDNGTSWSSNSSTGSLTVMLDGGTSQTFGLNDPVQDLGYTLSQLSGAGYSLQQIADLVNSKPIQPPATGTS